jgi:hypothetical protein
MLKRANERPLSAVPPLLWMVLAVFLFAQLAVALQRPPQDVSVAKLALPPSIPALKVLAFGEPEIAARLMMLWLQAQDYQPGVSIAFRELDYAVVEAWLDRMLVLDPDFDYALLAAGRLYGEVNDAPRQRRMIAFVERAFRQSPATRWRPMAHAVYLAQHRLHDLDLALELARGLAAAPADPAIPNWARQMHIFVLEKMGELETAKILLGGLLDSGQIVDQHERYFLSERLRELEQRGTATGAAPE